MDSFERLARHGLGLTVAAALATSACGGKETTDGATGANLDVDAIIGNVEAGTDVQNGQVEQFFNVALYGSGADDGTACTGAIAQVGSCCLYPPPAPIGTVDGPGDPRVELSAGPITVTDATTRSRLGTFGYDATMSAYDLAAISSGSYWTPGDTLTVSATGAGVAPFVVSAATLIPPIASLPPAVDTTQDLVITWTPDPNAQTTALQLDPLDDGTLVTCTVPDAAGTVTIDATLMKGFSAGAPIDLSLWRFSDTLVQTASGKVDFWNRAGSWAESRTKG